MKNFAFIEAVINIFKAVPIIENIGNEYSLDNKKNIEQGFFITENAFKNCPCVADEKILKFIKEKFGYDIFELNQGFYKSFDKVTKLSQQEISANKILHYLSTYGFESLGIFDRKTVYIPNDELELPENSDPIHITVINSIENYEIKTQILKMIQSGMAFSAETLNNLIEIINFLDIKFDIEKVANKELKIILYEKLEIMPKNPVEFLRYMIYLGTNTTLLIKSPEIIATLKTSKFNFDKYFSRYIAENGLAKLASIFHRFKPLWLAFKPHSKYMATTINKMRKLADKYHEPVTSKLLETITSARNINIDELKSELAKVTIFKKISLANSILYRNADPENIAYYIRNGKVFADEFHGNFKPDEKILSVILDSIVEDIKPNVEGKTVYIPENFNYAMPVSEKKFLGSIPYGSSYNFESKSAVVGVHWFNIKIKNREERIDLDLHLNSNKRDIGWQNDFEYENFIDTKENKVIFSGDMTDAPVDKGGATEAYFIGEKVTDEFMMVNLNNYTYSDMPVPFKLILADVNQDKIDRKYLIDSHEIAFCVPNEISSGEMFLGFLINDDDGNKKFYFTAGGMGKRIVARSDKNSEKMISATRTALDSRLNLKDILKMSGAIFEKNNDSDWDINLNPATVSKADLLGLFTKK